MIVYAQFSVAKTSRRFRVRYTSPDTPNKVNFRWFTAEHHARRWVHSMQATREIKRYTIEQVGR